MIVSDGMGHGKLALNCFLAKIIGSMKAKHPRLTASASFQMMQLDQTEVAVCKSDILASAVQSFNPTELLRDVLWKRCH